MRKERTLQFSQVGGLRHLGMSLEVVSVRLLPAFFAAEEGLDFVVGKNEAIVSGLVRKVFVFVHFQNLSGLVELALFGCTALGLDLAKLMEGAFELTGQALALGADTGESPHVFAKCQGHGEGGLSLGMVGVEAFFHFNDAEREEVGLD